MDTLQDASRVLRAAEASLRELMEHALRDHRYADVAAIAPAAAAVAKLVSGFASPGLKAATDQPGLRTEKRNSPSRKARMTGFPRFLRDDDKLVKIGWSKKRREEYEHRAPFVVASALLTAIRAKVRDGELFTAIDVIPLRSGDESVPDYQAYLALKWFQSEGIITKHPRDRYAIEPGRLGPKGLEEFWLRLPTIKGSKSGGSK